MQENEWFAGKVQGGPWDGQELKHFCDPCPVYGPVIHGLPLPGAAPSQITVGSILQGRYHWVEGGTWKWVGA